MPRPKRLQKIWLEFRRDVIPSASAKQANDMRHAFFCGAGVLFKMMLDLGRAEDDTEDQEAFEDIEKELIAYAKSAFPHRTEVN